jgi:hypothetical protein
MLFKLIGDYIMLRITVLSLLAIFSTMSYATDSKYLLIKGELACQVLHNSDYVCLDLKAPKGAASNTLVLTKSELMNLGAVPGTLKKVSKKI